MSSLIVKSDILKHDQFLENAEKLRIEYSTTIDCLHFQNLETFHYFCETWMLKLWLHGLYRVGVS